MREAVQILNEMHWLKAETCASGIGIERGLAIRLEHGFRGALIVYRIGAKPARPALHFGYDGRKQRRSLLAVPQASQEVSKVGWTQDKYYNTTRHRWIITRQYYNTDVTCVGLVLYF